MFFERSSPTAGGNRASPASSNRVEPERAICRSRRRREHESVVQAVAVGMLVMLAGTIPRQHPVYRETSVTFRACLGRAVVAVYLWAFWRYLSGDGPPPETRASRRTGLASQPVAGRVWVWGYRWRPWHRRARARPSTCEPPGAPAEPGRFPFRRHPGTHRVVAHAGRRAPSRASSKRLRFAATCTAHRAPDTVRPSPS
jgi:hypothetical protein